MVRDMAPSIPVMPSTGEMPPAVLLPVACHQHQVVDLVAIAVMVHHSDLACSEEGKKWLVVLLAVLLVVFLALVLDAI